LHPTKQINVLGKSVSTPSIVVHIADDNLGVSVGGGMGGGGGGGNGSLGSIGDCGGGGGGGGARQKIRQTKCPERQSSLD
jgi:hypothetical protein